MLDRVRALRRTGTANARSRRWRPRRASPRPVVCLLEQLQRMLNLLAVRDGVLRELELGEAGVELRPRSPRAAASAAVAARSASASGTRPVMRSAVASSSSSCHESRAESVASTAEQVDGGRGVQPRQRTTAGGCRDDRPPARRARPRLSSAARARADSGRPARGGSRAARRGRPARSPRSSSQSAYRSCSSARVDLRIASYATSRISRCWKRKPSSPGELRAAPAGSAA